jgi:hypothetical protein
MSSTVPTLPTGCAISHYWLIGPTGVLRQRLQASAEYRADVGENMTGPYQTFECQPGTDGRERPATAALVREVVPWMLEHDPAGIRRTLATVYTLAPDLTARLDEESPSQDWREMTHSELLRLGHGLSELLHSWGAAAGMSTVVFEDVHLAGTVDKVLIAQILRDLPPELVRVVTCSTTDRVPGVLGQVLEGLPRMDLRSVANQ